MKKIFIFLVSLQVSIASLGFSQTWIPFNGTQNPTEPSINLVTSSNQEVTIHCQTYGMNSSLINIEGVNYNRIAIPNVISSVTMGDPELPVITKLIAIPECSSLSATVLNQTETTLSNYNVYPAPEVVEEEINGQILRTEHFTINSQTYNTNSFLPQNIISIVTTGYLRGQKYAQITFYPIQFNPVTKSLKAITSCDLKIQFTNPITDINIPTGLFNNVAAHSFLNYPGDGKSASSTSPSENSSVTWINLTNVSQLNTLAIDYLIITASDFWDPTNDNSEIKRIALHRANHDGFAVGIINVVNILDEATNILPVTNSNPYWREQKIRNCIKQIYENTLAPNTYDHHLAYVLLAGDARYTPYPQANTSYGVPSAHDPAVIPFNGVNNNFPSDNYYALLTIGNNGFDPIPEIYIGRFPVNNTTELHNMVEKTIKYETEFSGQEFNNRSIYTNSHAPGATNYLTHTLGVYQDLLPQIISEPYTYTIFNEETLGINTPNLLVSELNSGSFLCEYYGHSHVDQLDYLNPLTTTELKNGLTNDYKTPFFFANSCDAGAFNQCEFAQESIAEEISRFSPTKGFVGAVAASAKALLNTNTPNGVWPKSYFDGIPYYIFEQASSVTGEFLLQCKILAQSNVFPGYVVQGNFYFNYFGDPALNLMAQGYQITHDITITNTTISNDVHVCSGATLTISGTIDFTERGRLIIDKGGELVLNGNCTFNGAEAYNAVEVNGLVTVSPSETTVSFMGKENGTFTGLILNNPYINVSFPVLNLYKAAIFGDDLQSFKVGVVGSIRSEFDYSALYFQNGDVEIKNTDFTNGTYANLRNPNLVSNIGVKISNCTFNGNNAEPFINIQDYSTFDIQDNTINFQRFDGIALYNSGFGTQTPHIINHNTINFVGTTYNNNNCIKVYHSQVDIINNTISNASYGISCLNISNVKIDGICSAPNASSTQQLINNRQNQIYATSKDYPYEIKFNHIDNTINSNPLVYHTPTIMPANPYLPIYCNHWGTPFYPNTELYPYGKYIYSPTWGFNNCSCSGGTAEEKFTLAESAELEEDYVNAEIGFKDIIENHSESDYAIASVNELYSVNLINNDLPALQSYLDTIPTDDSTTLSFRAQYVKNWCNVDLGNYDQAIEWFENRLISPESLEDSVFAIIDLNYVIQRSLEDNDLKSSPTCRFPEIIVKNQREFFSKRSQLIDLLYANKREQSNIVREKTQVEIKVYPNPVTNILNIEINSLLDESFVGKIRLSDELGKLVTEFNSIDVTSGKNSHSFSLSDVRPGVYYLNLYKIDEIISSCKVIVLPY